MDIANNFFGKEITEAIGWFIVHSLWQGILIAVLIGITLIVLKRSSAQFRYYFSFLSLLVLVVASSITFNKALKYANEKIELKQSIVNNPGYLSEFIKDNQLTNLSEPTLTDKSHFKAKRVLRRIEIQKHFSWIVSIWMIGLLFYFVRIVIGFLNHYRLVRSGRDEIGNTWNRKLREFIDRLKINKDITLYISTKIITPVTTGFLKPAILIPASLLSGLSTEQIEAIIAHELAHIKRNDYILNILQTLIETIFFFHPAVWYISSQIRKERENACDDIAIHLTNDKVSYAKALATAEEFVIAQSKFAMAFSPFRNTLLERIKRLNTKITMKTKLNEKLIAGIVILASIVFLSFILDGDLGQLKHEGFSTSEATVDTTTGSDAMSIHKALVDSSGNKLVTKRIYKAKNAELDSLIEALEERGEMSREIEKIVELAILDDDDLFAEEIIRSVQCSLAGIDFKLVVSDAMEAAKLGMKEAEEALREQNIHMKICDSLNEEFSDSLSEHTHLMVQEALAEACAELENLDINIVIADALEEATRSLKDIDFDVIITEALEEAHEEMEAERKNIVKIRMELDEDNMDMDEQELRLMEKEEALKQELEELEQEIKDLKKQQKEDAKDKKD